MIHGTGLTKAEYFNRMLSSNQSAPLKIPLWEAAILGHHEIVDLLLSSGADIQTMIFFDNTDEFSRKYKWCTLLHWMALKKFEGSHAKDYQYSTPLEIALKKGNLDWAEFLLKSGVRIDSLSWDTFSLVRSCIFKKTEKNCRKDSLVLLLKYGLDPNFCNKDGQKLFKIFTSFVREDHEDAVEVAKILLDSGVPFDKSMFRSAIGTDNLRLISFLIDQGADIDDDEKGDPPLLGAVGGGHDKVVDLLLARGADPNKPRYPLHLAVNRGNEYIIKSLLNAGADINARDIEGQTPLYDPCKQNVKEMIMFLLQRGADLTCEDDNGRTPFGEMIHFRGLFGNIRGSVNVMIKEFAKLRFENSLVSKKDMKMIQEDPGFLQKFKQCLAELEKMSNTMFYKKRTYYSVLKMQKNVKKFSVLTKNEEFVTNFNEGLGSFHWYKKDLKMIFTEAETVRRDFESTYAKLYSIFRDYLPEIVIEKVAQCLSPKDLPDDLELHCRMKNFKI